MSTTNDTRPGSPAPTNAEIAERALFEIDRLLAQLATERAALELCRASRVALMDLVERERAKVAELVAALAYIEGRLPSHDTKAISQARAALARAKKASK